MAHLASLLRQVAGQDAAAFNELYLHCAHRVYGLARRIITDPEISAEVTQEVFVSVWQQAARYQENRGHPLTWLLTLTHRRSVDRIRSEEANRQRDRAWGLKNQDQEFDSVAEQVLATEDRREVRACFEQLSHLQREAIQLAYYRGMTYTEVAQHLGVPLPTAKTRIRDGLITLRKCMTPSSS